MENKINIAEILKDCPKGMELYSPLCGDCKLYDVNDYNIRIETNKDTLICLYHDGRYCANGEIMLFPKGKTTWEGFVPPCQLEDGKIVATNNGLFIGIIKVKNNRQVGAYCSIDYSEDFIINSIYGFERIATADEKAKLFQAIKDNGYKWDAENKTLEKLNKNKFDITTLKPFKSEVLVRDCDGGIWKPTFWGEYLKDSNYGYLTTSGYYKQCIPYEGNEHLLGKTDDCDEYFKVWEE